MPIIAAKALRVMIGDIDISDMVRSLTINAEVGDAVTTDLTLLGLPTIADGVIQLRAAEPVVADGTQPRRAIFIRTNYSQGEPLP
jgi:hypothetical protein